MRRNTVSRAWNTPALEARQLLSGGNVQAALAGGTLTITGDSLSNEVAVEQTSEGLRVKGLKGTRVNGAINGAVTFANPTQTNIQLKGGGDRLTLGGYQGGSVSVVMGSGNDQVTLAGINVPGDLVIDLGAGNDGLAAILGGVSNTTPNIVDGNVNFLGGAGNDRLIVNSLSNDGNLTLDSGAGNDVVLLGEGGTDGTSSILLGTGNDIMAIGNRTSRGIFTLDAGAGDDLLGISGSQFAESATFNMGAGKDALLSQNNLFQINLTRAGGTGIDTLFSSSDSIVGNNQVTGFESLPTSPAAVATLATKLANAFI